MKYFNVRIGYDDGEVIVIDETELETAIRAQITGKVALLNQGTVSGNHIISIKPNYSKVEKIYNPSGPDLLPRGTEGEHHQAIRDAEEVVQEQLRRRPSLGEPEFVKQLT